MTSAWESFERFKQRGLDARRAGEYESAKIYLLEAARSMVQLSKQSTGDLATAREQMAQRMLELARDCDRAKDRPRSSSKSSSSSQPSAESSSEGDESADAKNWMVREKPTLRFDDVAGLDDVKEEIRLKMLYPFAHADLAERFGLKAGGGVLLYGPPGTGKTMLAKATAGEIDAAFFRVSAAEILSKWVGEAEQNIKQLFDAAKAEKRAIIFIDEIEAMLPARRDEGSSVMQRVVPQFLQAMEGFDKNDQSNLMFLGATNVPWQLDPAVLRPGRFDAKVYIPLPDLPARLKLLEIYLAKRPLDPKIDLNQLAESLDGYSGADIKYLCDRAAMLPFMQTLADGTERTIDASAIESARESVKPSVHPDALKRFEEWASQQ